MKREKDRTSCRYSAGGRRDERLLLCYVEEGRVWVRGWTGIIVDLSLILNLTFILLCNSLREIAPDLVAAVSRHAFRSRRVASTLINHAWIADITGALSISVLVQYLELRQQLDQVLLQAGSQDKQLIWRWTASGQFTTQSAYQASGPILRLGR
jgi:hypothetical protein